MEKNIKLEHPVTLGWLLRFALPTVFSTVFMSLYLSADGMFVVRLVDTNALSYTDAQYFSYAFKQDTGCSPSRFRELTAL